MKPKPLTLKEKLSLWQIVAHSINEAAYEFLNLNHAHNDYTMYNGLRGGLRRLCTFSAPTEIEESEGAFETWATKNLSTLRQSSRS